MNEIQLKSFMEQTVLENLKCVEVQAREALTDILKTDLHPEIKTIDFQISSCIFNLINIYVFATNEHDIPIHITELNSSFTHTMLFRLVDLQSDKVHDYQEFIEEQLWWVDDTIELKQFFHSIIRKWFIRTCKDLDFAKKDIDFFITIHDSCENDLIYDLKKNEFVSV